MKSKEKRQLTDSDWPKYVTLGEQKSYDKDVDE